MFLSESIQQKWQPVLDHPDLPEVKDSYKRAVTSVILENQEKALKEDAAFLSEAAPTNATGSSIQNWNPILISLVRRACLSCSMELQESLKKLNFLLQYKKLLRKILS